VSADRVDVLIIAALPAELEAAKAAGAGPWQQRSAGGSAPYWQGEYDCRDGRRLSVALARSAHMGGRETAPIVTTLTDLLRPRCLAMCGVCAGNPDDVMLGDVVVADPVYEWDEGKRSPAGFLADNRSFRLDHRWAQAAQEFSPTGLPSHGPAGDDDARHWLLERLHRGQNPREHPARGRYFPEGTWAPRLRQWVEDGLIERTPDRVTLTDRGARLVRARLFDDVDGPRRLPFEVVVAPMASGSAVAADGTIWDTLQGLGMRKTAAVEMEAATVATVAHQRQVPFCLIAKGVMDHADSAKADGYKQFAARASAEVLFALLDRLLPADAPPTIAPFLELDRADIYGDGDRATTAMQRGEYGAATTAPLPEFDEIVEHLRTRRIARVCGKSGTGKTTMAAMVGRDAGRFDAAFYVDLAALNAPFSVTDMALLIERVTALDGPGRLLVVDNTHLDQRLERNVVNHWLNNCGAGSLLLLTRRDEPDFDSRVPGVRLAVSTRSLLAVWQRMDAATDAALAAPSDGALLGWQDTFPDLVTFTLAMRGSIGRLAAGATTLSQQDAVAFIRMRYLTDRAAEEVENLRRLAVAGRYEFGLGPKSLLSGGLTALVREGLVHTGSRHHTVGHPAVSELLLRAIGVPADLATLEDIAESEPYVASGIASRLVQAGRRSDAARLLAHVLVDGALRDDIVAEFNLSNLLRITRQLVSLGVARPEDIDDQLARERDRLAAKVAQSPPPEIMHSLAFDKVLPRTAALLQSLIRRPEVRDEFVAWSYDALIWSLLNVGMALQKFDPGLSRTLLTNLFDARGADLADELGRASCSDLGSSCRAAVLAGRESMFHAALAERVGAALPEIVRQCIRRGPQEIIAYHAVLIRDHAELAAEFRNRLADGATRPDLDAALANTQAGSIVGLLAWAGIQRMDGLVGHLEEVIDARLRGDGLARDLLVFSAADYAAVLRAVTEHPALRGALPAVLRCLDDNVDVIARRAALRPATEYVHLAKVLQTHAPALAAELDARIPARS
jgi:nucleoside phosphorylase